MNAFAELLESELNEVLVKQNKDAIKRVSYLFGEKLDKIQKLEDKMNQDFRMIEQRELENKSDIKLLAETMKQGFDTINKRFETVDKRFEEMQKNMDKRFDMMFKFMGLGFSILSILIVIFKFMK